MRFLTNESEDKIIEEVICLINNHDALTVLSPYLTNNKAIKLILEKEIFQFTLVINFTVEIFMQQSTELDTLKEILRRGHKVLFDNDLHSKIYMANDYGILGSANFTYNGLERRHESCIGFDKAHSPILFKECTSYCSKIIDNAEPLTLKLIEDTELIIQSNKPDIQKKNLFHEILPQKSQEQSLRERYEEDYYYPKTLAELDPNLHFDHIDFEQLEDDFVRIFPSKGRKDKQDELVDFVKYHLYDKNRGYGMKTKLRGKSTTLGMWYRRNWHRFFNEELKPYQTEFIRDRKQELIGMYRQKYNIEPISGIFNSYKPSSAEIPSFFEITFREYQFMDKIRKIDSFFEQNEKYPTTGKRALIKYRKDRGVEISQEEEFNMRYESRLGDHLSNLKKKLKNDELFPKEAAILLKNAKKWGFEVN